MNSGSKITRTAGIAGIIAGLGLAVEFALFMASGWTPEVFDDPAAALVFLESGGTLLRAAAFVGIVNLAATVLFLVGLTEVLRPEAPARSATALYVGLLGLAAHALVPVGLWLGTPLFVEMAAGDHGTARAAWGGFDAFLNAAGGVGYVFAGVAYAAAGWAIVSSRRFGHAVGWIGLIGGVASALTILGAETWLTAVAAAAYLPALLGVVVFRTWAGTALVRLDHANRRAAYPSAA